MTTPVTVTLSPELASLQTKVRAFAQQEIKPIAAERDRFEDPLGPFPWDVWRKGSQLGLRTLALPREYGGIGLDALGHCVLLEEICVADSGFGANWHMAWMASILLLATDYLKQHFLPRFLADDDYMFSLGLTEPNIGSDNILPYNGTDGGVQTTAVRQPNGDWVINGKKHFQTGGGLSKGVFVICRTDPTRGVSEGTTMFFLESTTPGFHFGHVHSKLGWRMSPNAELIFEDVRVPAEAQVGELGKGLAALGAATKPAGATTPVFAIGSARAAFEMTIDRCRTELRDGRPAIEHQSVAMRLADMWADIEIARTMAWKTAWDVDYNPDPDPKLLAISEIFGAEMVIRVCANAMQLWDEEGFRRERPIEKIWRDAFANYHIDGTNDLARLRVGRGLAGKIGTGMFD